MSVYAPQDNRTVCQRGIGAGERWRIIDTIHRAARKCIPNNREAFLAAACGVDTKLRREVESLLADDVATWGITKPPDLLEISARGPGMATAIPEGREDPLAYLPRSALTEHTKGQLIYGEAQRSNGLFLVIDGKVKVGRTTDDGRQAVVDIYLPDELFGESGLIRERLGIEYAVAMEPTKVMGWSAAQIEASILREPRLSIALIQLVVKRCIDFHARIGSYSTDTIDRRLVLSLIRFSERLGSNSAHGFTEMIPFTHELRSQYVGTSREIITHFMNRLRRNGYIRYSRKGIALNQEALRGWLLEGDGVVKS